jgi:hypothetical protein
MVPVTSSFYPLEYGWNSFKLLDYPNDRCAMEQRATLDWLDMSPHVCNSSADKDFCDGTEHGHGAVMTQSMVDGG